ncbi:acyltransferase family protein [Winogradskyella sediminis]|uniref:acyltransferase family protein n=1 Tax=Winogradskyella sediminis TaxID=1382466 RepID=UPI003AA8CAAA
MKLITGFTYRPEIDGLRALAVLAVVFFHVGLGFPGGYIGVDIFFVISGFLITSLIIKELQEDRFSFLNFYGRRIRRIFPASAVMVLVTVIMGWFLLLPSDFIGLGKSVISQTFFGSNIYFWRNTNYFAESAELQPLLHTWSLAVEEQFYMIVPLLLWALIKWLKINSRLKLVLILAIAFFASLILSMLVLPTLPAFTFYMLPTRAWEMLIGSLVALAPVFPVLKSRMLRELIVIIGLLGMLLPCFLYTKDTLFPGLYALPPCLGAALFILGASPKYDATLPIAAKLFTWRPIIFIGLISYSLYLWHWPLVAFSNYWALEEFSLGYKWAIVLLSIVLAILSWRYVETPFRKKTLAKTNKALYLYAFVVSGAFVVLGGAMYLNNGFQTRFNSKVIAFDTAKSEALHENRISLPVTLEVAKQGAFPRFGDTLKDPIDVLVWGDSHARAILPGVIKTAGDTGSVAVAWHSSTAPVLNNIPADMFAGFSLGADSPEWAKTIIHQVDEKQISNVIIAARWSVYYEDYVKEGSDSNFLIENFNANLLKTIKALVQTGTNVWVLREVPNHAIAVPKALIKRELFSTNLSHYQCDLEGLKQQNKYFDALAADMVLAGATILDGSDLLLDKSKGVYKMEKDAEALYYDAHHLTKTGAGKVSAIFEPIFSTTSSRRSMSYDK